MGQKAVFLDRDDTIVRDPGYISDPDQVELLPGAGEALRQLRQMGYRLVVITNQSAVARGMVTEEVLHDIHHRLKELLAKQNAYLDGIYYCPYHPEGTVQEYSVESDMRKPGPGMVYQAADELGIDLNRSWMVGDSYRDIAAGKSAGCKTVLINSPANRKSPGPGDPMPDREAVNIKEAANIIRMVDSSQNRPRPSTDGNARNTAANSQPDAESKSVNTQVQNKEPIQKKNPPQARQKPDTQKSNSQSDSGAAEPVPDRTTDEQVSIKSTLDELLVLIRKNNRRNMYEDFSILKVVAGIAQGVVLFCLLISLWFLMDATKTAQAVQNALLYGVIFQLIVVSFFLMDARR